MNMSPGQGKYFWEIIQKYYEDHGFWETVRKFCTEGFPLSKSLTTEERVKSGASEFVPPASIGHNIPKEFQGPSEDMLKKLEELKNERRKCEI